MSTACPKCRDVELSHPGGRASQLLRCHGCRGTWVPKDEARLEAVGALLESDSTIRPTDTGDGRTGLCPEGHGILIRARVDADPGFFLERCPTCHGIWFDKGEWNALAQAHLLDHLDDLWDPAFRRQLAKSSSPAEARARLAADVGSELLSALDALVGPLSELSPRQRNSAFAYVRRQLKDG